MSIKWNALMVSEAMDMVERYVNQAIEPLEQAKLVATEAYWAVPPTRLLTVTPKAVRIR